MAQDDKHRRHHQGKGRHNQILDNIWGLDDYGLFSPSEKLYASSVPESAGFYPYFQTAERAPEWYLRLQRELSNLPEVSSMSLGRCYQLYDLLSRPELYKYLSSHPEQYHELIKRLDYVRFLVVRRMISLLWPHCISTYQTFAAQNGTPELMEAYPQGPELTLTHPLKLWELHHSLPSYVYESRLGNILLMLCKSALQDVPHVKALNYNQSLNYFNAISDVLITCKRLPDPELKFRIGQCIVPLMEALGEHLDSFEQFKNYKEQLVQHSQLLLVASEAFAHMEHNEELYSSVLECIKEDLKILDQAFLPPCYLANYFSLLPHPSWIRGSVESAPLRHELVRSVCLMRRKLFERLVIFCPEVAIDVDENDHILAINTSFDLDDYNYQHWQNTKLLYEDSSIPFDLRDWLYTPEDDESTALEAAATAATSTTTPASTTDTAAAASDTANADTAEAEAESEPNSYDEERDDGDEDAAAVTPAEPENESTAKAQSANAAPPEDTSAIAPASAEAAPETHESDDKKHTLSDSEAAIAAEDETPEQEALPSDASEQEYGPWARGALLWWLKFRNLPDEEQRQVRCDEQVQSLFLELQQRLAFLKNEHFSKDECLSYAHSLPRTEEIDNLWCDAHLKTILDEVCNALYESLLDKSSKLEEQEQLKGEEALEQYVKEQVSAGSEQDETKDEDTKGTPEIEADAKESAESKAQALPAGSLDKDQAEVLERNLMSAAVKAAQAATTKTLSEEEHAPAEDKQELGSENGSASGAGGTAAAAAAAASSAVGGAGAATAAAASRMVLEGQVKSNYFGPQRVSILGATGSIGDSTCEVLRQHPERYVVHALAAGSNVEKMLSLIAEFHPARVAMSNEQAAAQLRERLKADPALNALHVDVCAGESGVVEVAGDGTAEIVVAAIVGSSGLAPVLSALKTGCRICLANKEALVMSGQLFFDVAQQFGSTVLPVDSEHSAIFQCLPPKEQCRLGFCHLQEAGVKEILLTGSGGPFRDCELSALKSVTPQMAINHPVWSMGPKISVDSATMMNKALEFIEARYLFNASAEQIKVIVHPQSVIHSMVSYQDGAVMAQMGCPDMKTPIAHALAYPERISAPVESLDFTKISALTFKAPDKERYPCLFMGIEASAQGQAMTTALNAANEVAVDAFLKEQISFLSIADVVKYVLDQTSALQAYSLEEIMDVDTRARALAYSYVASHQK